MTDLQYGFRRGMGTIDQCLNLLIGKYTKAKGEGLYLAFMDLSAAFDCVQHNRLWVIMAEMGVDSNSNILGEMYTGASAQVRYVPMGECTNAFPVQKGLKQGCVLAPFLFCLYVNQVGVYLTDKHLDVPRVGPRTLPILLYADDAVLMA